MTDVSVRLQGLDGLLINISPERVLEDNSTHSYTVYYEKDGTNYLSLLCDKYGSDKGSNKSSEHPYPWPPHSYTDFVNSRFWHCRETVRRVFECGLGTNNPHIPSTMGPAGKPGASLRVWRDYFPNAEIFGADIDESILFTEPRIRTFHVDQTSKNSIEKMWNEIGVFDFDLMIDDGLHTFDAGRSLFENSIDKLSKTGQYIIEDVAAFEMLQYKSLFSQRSFKIEYVTLKRPSVSLDRNNLVIIRH